MLWILRSFLQERRFTQTAPRGKALFHWYNGIKPIHSLFLRTSGEENGNTTWHNRRDIWYMNELWRRRLIIIVLKTISLSFVTISLAFAFTLAFTFTFSPISCSCCSNLILMLDDEKSSSFETPTETTKSTEKKGKGHALFAAWPGIFSKFRNSSQSREDSSPEGYPPHQLSSAFLSDISLQLQK